MSDTTRDDLFLCAKLQQRLDHSLRQRDTHSDRSKINAFVERINLIPSPDIRTLFAQYASTIPLLAGKSHRLALSAWHTFVDRWPPLAQFHCAVLATGAVCVNAQDFEIKVSAVAAPDAHKIQLCWSFKVDAAGTVMPKAVCDGLPTSDIMHMQISDKRALLALLHKDASALYYSTGALKRDRDIIRRASEADFAAIKFLHPNDRTDWKICLKAIHLRGEAFRLLSRKVKSSRRFVHRALLQNWRAYEFTDLRFQPNRDFKKQDHSITVATIALRAVTFHTEVALSLLQERLPEDVILLIGEHILCGLLDEGSFKRCIRLVPVSVRGPATIQYLKRANAKMGALQNLPSWNRALCLFQTNKLMKR